MQDEAYRLPENFYADIERILGERPAGIREYDLLQMLKQHGYFRFSQTRPAAPLELFHMHFLLFHALYHLQQDGFRRQSAILEIDPLAIRLRDYEPGENALAAVDPLRDFYLDLANMHNMSKTGVDALLEAFWREFARFEQRDTALAELGLCDPVDDTAIKQAYRRLAMKHHPDRGGEAWRLQAINAAYEYLCKTRR